MRRPFSPQTDAVSVVVGALLILAIIVATTVTIRVAYVPVWQADKEATHMGIVQDQFASLKAGLDRQTDVGDFIPQSHPISLGAASTSIFGGQPPANSLRYDPDSAPFRLYTTKLNLQTENGTSYLGTDETWSAIAEPPAATGLTNVGRVLALRLQLASIDETNIDDAVTITVTDRNGAFAGDFRVQVEDHGAGAWAIGLRTQKAGPSLLYQSDIARPAGTTLSPYFLDVLSSEYQFGAVLAVAQGPVTLTLQANDASGAFSAQFAITYEEVGVGGVALRGGTGLVRDDFLIAQSSGRLTFQGLTSYFPQQTLRLEHGAVLLTQADGSVIVVDPGFEAHAVGSTTVLSLAIPSLVGDGTELTGRSSVAIKTTPTFRSSLQGEVPNFSLNVTSLVPAAWALLFNESLAQMPGFVYGTHWLVSQGSNWANLNVYGATAAPASSAYDISVQVKYVIARIEVES